MRDYLCSDYLSQLKKVRWLISLPKGTESTPRPEKKRNRLAIELRDRAPEWQQ